MADVGIAVALLISASTLPQVITHFKSLQKPPEETSWSLSRCFSQLLHSLNTFLVWASHNKQVGVWAIIWLFAVLFSPQAFRSLPRIAARTGRW